MNYDFTKVPKWVHILIAGIILAVIVFATVKLLIWNKGTAELDRSETGSFEVEVLDQIFLLSEDKKEGHTFDDEETILFLGNDAITFDQGETSVAAQVASKLGANCINCGFPASTVAMRNPALSEDYPMDAFSFYNVANAIANEDFSSLEANVGKFDDYTYTGSTDRLKNLDFNNVDTIVIYYNAQDYMNLRIGMNPDNEFDQITYRGALNAGIKALQEKYPYIRIVCMSFTMCYAFDSSGQLVSGDRFDFGNGKLTTYLQFMIDVSGERGVSFVDNYYGTIHEDNSSEWMLDNIHVNAQCNEYVADHFVRVIYPNGLTKE
ncbi:MAG: hypothetical protein II842_18490 [Butyrivibrio sp.]|nr:hypothetical protein [Butyrivibrio sp.]